MSLRMDQNALRPGQLHFYRALREICDHSGMVLHCHVFFSSEPAAYQFISDLYLLCRKAQKEHALVLGIINSLVGRINQYSIPAVRHSHRAFRFQKRVFRPGSMELLRQHMGGTADRFLSIPPVNMPVCHKISVLMHLRSVLLHCLPRISHHLEFFIFHFHQTFGFLQNFRRLCCHKGNGVSQIMGNLSDRNHSIPVLLQMTDFYIAGNVLRRKYRHHSRKGFRLFRVDGFYKGAGIF